MGTVILFAPRLVGQARKRLPAVAPRDPESFARWLANQPLLPPQAPAKDEQIMAASPDEVPPLAVGDRRFLDPAGQLDPPNTARTTR